MAIGGGFGLLLGLLTGTFRIAETLLDTTFQIVRHPGAGADPVVILWFGIDESAKLFLVAVGGVLSDLPQHLPRHPSGRPGT